MAAPGTCETSRRDLARGQSARTADIIRGPTLTPERSLRPLRNSQFSMPQNYIALNRCRGKRPGAPATYRDTRPNGFDDSEGPSTLQEAVG